MVLCGKCYTTLYCQCKYQLPEGFWRQHTAIIKPTDIYSQLKVSKYYNSYGRFFLIQVRLRSSHMLCAMYNGIFQAKRFQLVSITKTLEDNNLCCALSLTYFQSSDETLCKAISTNLENFGYLRISIFFHLFGGKMTSIGIHKMQTASVYILYLNQA